MSLVETEIKFLEAPLEEFTGACLADATKKVRIALEVAVAAEVVELLEVPLMAIEVVVETLLALSPT